MAAAPGPGRALVTGCAGFIGSHLTERLLGDGWSVRGVDAFTDYYARARKLANLEQALATPWFELHELDLSDDPLDELLEGVDTVFHLAAQAGVRGSFGRTFGIYVRDNVLATQRLLDAAVRHGVGRVVYASSSSVYGDAESFPTPEDAPRRPVSPYGMTKVATEELAGVYGRTYGLPSVGLRYFSVYGPRQRPDMAFHRFIEAGLSGGSITVLGDGRQVRDFTYVQDAVWATVAAAGLPEPGTLVLNVGAGRPVELIDVIRILNGMLERPLEIRHADPQAGDARHTSGDVSLAAALLGYAPPTDLETGLRAQLEAVMASRALAAAAR